MVWKVSIPTITVTGGTEGPRVEWKRQTEWELGKERQTSVAKLVRRRDACHSGELILTRGTYREGFI